MKTKTVTLRNIYKLLTSQDYPLPSLSVISEKNRSGITQTVFCTEVCMPEFQQGHIGKMIWRTTGNRNRYFSNLCNRMLPENLYKQYTQEIARVLNPRLVLAQTQKFYTFLQSYNFRPEILKIRLSFWIRTMEENEEACGPTVSLFFDSLIKQSDNVSAVNTKQHALLLSGILTWLFIYSLTGSNFADLLKSVSTEQDRFDIAKQMRKRNVSRPVSQTDTSVEYLGSLRQLTGQGLPARQYYGHASEIMDLLDAVSCGEKILISGIGGLGKTEITRQVLQLGIQRNTLRRVCLIEYSGSLRTSFRKAFSFFNQSNDEEEERIQILGYLAKNLGENCLLVLDNMDTVTADDHLWLETIRQASYAVIITSRMSAVSGFRTFPLSETKPEDCLLIYRSNIEERVSSADKQLFLDIMKDPLFCHPLTTLMISKTVRQHSCTLEQIRTEIQKKRLRLSMKLDDRSECLSAMYRHLYNLCHMTQDEKDTAEFFTLLPVDSYSAEWLKTHAPGGDNAEEAAKRLAEAGYLTDTGNGYAMHHLIRQCLKSKNITDKRLSILLTPMIRRYRELYDQCQSGSFNDTRLQKQLSMDECVLSDILPVVLKNSKDRYILNTLIETGFIMSVGLTHEQRTKLKPLVENAIRDIVVDPLLAETYLIINEANLENDDLTARIGKHYRALLEDRRDLSLPIIRAFLLSCSDRVSSPELALEMLHSCLESSKTEKDILIARVCTGLAYLKAGDLEHALPYAEHTDEHLDKMNDTDFSTAFAFLSSVYLITQNKVKMQNILSFMEKRIKVLSEASVYHDYFYYDYLLKRAVYYLQTQEYAKALNDFLEVKDYLTAYYGKRHNGYHSVLENIAQTYAKLHNYDNSEIFYRELEENERNKASVFQYSMTLNNYGVMLIDAGRPAEAIKKLNICLDILEDDTVALAEPYRNLARACDMLGRKEEALRYWQKAYPLLIGLYGENHERTKEALKNSRRNM